MTKAELLIDLNGRDFVGFVGTPELKEEKPEDKAKWYIVNIREVVLDVANYSNVGFYVVDEGLKTEKAYYKDSEPKTAISVSADNLAS